MAKQKVSNRKRSYRNNSQIFKQNFISGIRDANDFYIHFNNANIGNRGQLSKIDLTAQYAKRRENINRNLRNQYIKLFDTNLLNGETIKSLSDALDINQTEVLNILNTEMVKTISQSINSSSFDNINTLISLGNKDEINMSNLNKVVSQVKGTNDSITATKNMLNVIAQAVALIEGEYGADVSSGLAALILNSINNGSKATEIGIKLQDALQNFKKNNNGTLYSEEVFIKVINGLYNLAFVLENAKFKSTNKKISAKGLSILLKQNILSTNIGEGLAINAFGQGIGAIKKEIDHVGASTVIVDSTGRGKTFYNEWTDYGHRMLSSLKRNSQHIIRKADMQVSSKNNTGFSIDVTIPTSDQEGFAKTVDIILGLSTKFYTGLGFNNNDHKAQGVYSSGSGGSLANAIATVWTNLNQRYFIYNYIAHDMFTSEINDLILRRMLIRLFSSAGGSGEDFAQIIFLNGILISLWDLVQYIRNNTFISNNAITLNYDKKSLMNDTKTYLPKGDAKPSLIEAWRRSRFVNLDFHKTKIQADIHLNKLIAAINI